MGFMSNDIWILLFALLAWVVNYRREVWKKRAIEYKAQLKIAGDRMHVIRQLTKDHPKFSVTFDRPVGNVEDWPEKFDEKEG